MVLLGEHIWAIGPCEASKDKAQQVIQGYMKIIDRIKQKSKDSYQLECIQQKDGCYALVIAEELKMNGMNEMMYRRFQKVLQHQICILTSFFIMDNSLECLAFTEGLGIVLYPTCSYY